MGVAKLAPKNQPWVTAQGGVEGDVRDHEPYMWFLCCFGVLMTKMKNMGWEPQSAFKRLESVVRWTLENDRWLIT